MSDILTEKPIPIGEAPKHIPGRPHAATVWRWYQHGVRGVKLETYLVGGKRFTSAGAIQRFIRQSTEAQDGPAINRAPSRQRQKQIEAADAELERAGI